MTAIISAVAETEGATESWRHINIVQDIVKLIRSKLVAAFKPNCSGKRVEKMESAGVLISLFLDFSICKIDALVKSMETPFSVIPAQAGIQSFQGVPMRLDTRFRGYDDFLRGRQD